MLFRSIFLSYFAQQISRNHQIMDWIGLDLTFPITDPTWIFLLVLLIILFAPILLKNCVSRIL